MEKEIVKKKKSSQSTRLKNQIKKIEETKVDTINFDDLQLLDENFDKLINTDPRYSLQVDPLNIYNMSDEQKDFIKYYCQLKNVQAVCKLLSIDNDKGIDYYKSYASQQEIRRINLAMYSRQFSAKMLNIDQIGSYLTSLITDDNVALVDRLTPKDKLTATKMLIDLNDLKRTAYENATIIDNIEIDTELEKLSAKSIKQLIENSKDPIKDLSKDEIIDGLDINNKLSLEEKIYLKSLSINELLALQENINKEK